MNKIKKREGDFFVIIKFNNKEFEIPFKKKGLLLREAADMAVEEFFKKNKKDTEEKNKKEFPKKINALLKKQGINNFVKDSWLIESINKIIYSIGGSFLCGSVPQNYNGLNIISYYTRNGETISDPTPEEVVNTIKRLYQGFLTDHTGRERPFVVGGGKIHYNKTQQELQEELAKSENAIRQTKNEADEAIIFCKKRERKLFKITKEGVRFKRTYSRTNNLSIPKEMILLRNMKEGVFMTFMSNNFSRSSHTFMEIKKFLEWAEKNEYIKYK